MATQTTFRVVLDTIRRVGLLMEHDSHFLSVTSIVAGNPIKGSWWGHRAGNNIHQITQALRERPDILVSKFLDGKISYIHEKLWPAFFAVATCGEEWQYVGLSKSDKTLLDFITKCGSIQSDDIVRKTSYDKQALRNSLSKLERRLLIHSVDVHSKKGFHIKLLSNWKVLATSLKIDVSVPSVSAGKRDLEEAVTAMCKGNVDKCNVPWPCVLASSKV